MPMAARNEAGCSQKTLFMLDATALMLIAVSPVLLGLLPIGDGQDGSGWGREASLAFSLGGGVVMIGALVLSLRMRPDGDEYTRRLTGQATMFGFYFTMTSYVIWRPLADSLAPSPTSDQLLGLLFAGTGVGYFISRARGIA